MSVMSKRDPRIKTHIIASDVVTEHVMCLICKADVMTWDEWMATKGEDESLLDVRCSEHVGRPPQ